MTAPRHPLRRTSLVQPHLGNRRGQRRMSTTAIGADEVSDMGTNKAGVHVEADRDQLTDYELMLRVGARDADAFRELAQRHASRLFRLAQSLAHHKSDAEDLVQETFMAAYRGAKHFRGDASPKTWLGQILARRAATAWRRNRYRRATVSLDSAAMQQPDSRSSDGDEASIARADELAVLTEIIKTLAPPYREVLVLREMQGLSYREIAQALNVPLGTVESRLWSARRELRRRLSEATEKNQRSGRTFAPSGTPSEKGVSGEGRRDPIPQPRRH
jgi:RNA polymerase sigma-70 factor (ECF subfamily)